MYWMLCIFIFYANSFQNGLYQSKGDHLQMNSCKKEAFPDNYDFGMWNSKEVMATYTNISN